MGHPMKLILAYRNFYTRQTIFNGVVDDDEVFLQGPEETVFRVQQGVAELVQQNAMRKFMMDPPSDVMLGK